MERIGVIGKEKVLIVGGNSGIGEAVSRVLQRAHRLDYDQFIPTKDFMDVTSRHAVETFIEAYGPFRYIVYSAGTNELCWASAANVTAVAEDAFDVNCAGFIQVISEHIRQWPDNPLSAVAVSSDAAEIPMRGSVAYCASKAALNMAVRCLARELAPFHRINAVAPGMVDGTPMTEYIDETITVFRGWTPDQARNYERQNVPTKRRATLSEVAETIVWVLLGPEQMTGSIVSINGGRS
jgi:NAD(P)-dependent dehydrogenase (short-subunit alcohol dehydrogenase family)